MNNRARELPAFVPLAVLALALLALYHRLLLGESFVWGLPTLQFYPWRAYALDLMAQGQLPLWNAYNGAGAPLFANYQSALLYPLNWLSFPLPLAPSMTIISVLHLFIAGWGMWMLGGRLGYSVLGRGMSALAFGMTSYLVARLGTFPMISAAAWLPWLCWAALGVVTLHRRLDAAWLALFTALLLLAGHAQTAWYALLLTGFFALWHWLRQRPLRPIVLVGLGGSVLLGAGIAALQLAATGELLLSSQRAGGVERDFGLNFSYGLARALNLLSPNIFGTPADGSYFTEGAFFEDAVYVGLIPLVSAVAALIAWLRLRRSEGKPAYISEVPFWWGIVLVGFVLALGSNSPIFPFLYDNIPTFDLFQAPVRWHLWTAFSLSILAGAGVAAWGRGRRAKRWAGRLTAICVALALVGFVGMGALEAGVDDNDTIVTLLRGVFATGLIGVLGGVLTLTQPEATSSKYPRWTLAALALVAVDLAWAAQGLNPTLRADFVTTRGDPSVTRTYWTADVEETVKFDQYFLLDDYRVISERWDAAHASGLPNLNLLDGQSQFNNFDPLRAGGYQDYLTLIESSESDTDALLAGAHVGAVYAEDATLVPLETPTQRAWLVEAACWHADDVSIRAALLDDWTPTAQVHLGGAGDCAASNDEPIGEITAISDESNLVTISMDVERAGWLVLADTHYPGWHAEVNGSAAPIYRANLAFRAVAVTPDTQTVRFIYQPAWLVPGALISGVALLVLLVLFRVGVNEARK